MINKLGVNEKVGKLRVNMTGDIHNRHDPRFDVDLVEQMTRNYRNLYHIFICDSRKHYFMNERDIHDQLGLLVKK